MDFTQYIKPDLLVLVAVLYIVGLFIKNSGADNRRIPMILGGLGVALAAVFVVATTEVINVALAVFTAAVQGILCAGAAVYGNELFKQYKDE